jgi:ATP-dependent Clp protease protease subunit
MTRHWYHFRAQAKGAEIVIYDEIGAFGVPAKAFLDELQALGPVAQLTVRINSPGGSVFDGVAIYNALKATMPWSPCGSTASPPQSRA